MITVGNFNPVPNGSISVSPDYYYYGEEVIGGVMNLEVQGTHHAATASEYSGMIETILGMIDTCQALSGSIECGSNITSLNNTQAVVKDVSVSPGGSPLDLSYTINLECSKDSAKKPLIANQSSIGFTTIHPNVVVNSYEQSAGFEDSTSSTFVVAGNGNAYKSHGKYSISVGVGIYDSDRCDSSNINYKSGISAFLEQRANALVGSDKVLESNNFTYIGSASQKTVGESEGSASFELIAAPKGLGGIPIKALVDYTVTKTTDQKKELSTTTIKGSIQGIDSGSSFLYPSFAAFSNATSAYNQLSKEVINPDENVLNISCPIEGEEGEGSTTTPGGGGGGEGGDSLTGGVTQYTAPAGTCLKKYSSRVSEFPASARIEFETVYKEVEDCELLGYKIRTSYEERPSVSGRAEHLAPNRPNNFYPLTYYSSGVSAPKYRLTVTADMPSTCVSNPVGPSGYKPSGVNDNGVLVTAVNAELTVQKNRFKLIGGNIMRTTRSITEARYSYSITEEYIKCQ